MFQLSYIQKLERLCITLNNYDNMSNYIDDYFHLLINIPKYLIPQEEIEKINNISPNKIMDLKKVFTFCFENYLQQCKYHYFAEFLCSVLSANKVFIKSSFELEEILLYPNNPIYKLNPEIIEIISKLNFSDTQTLAEIIANKLNIKTFEDDSDSEENSLDETIASFEEDIIDLIQNANNVIFKTGGLGVDKLKKILKENDIPIVYSDKLDLSAFEDSFIGEKIYINERGFPVLSGLGASTSSGSCGLEHEYADTSNDDL